MTTAVAIGVDTQTHDEAPAAPRMPAGATDGESSDGEPTEGEYDADSPERMMPTFEPSWIPPPQCTGRLGMGWDSLSHQTGPKGLFRPPRA